MSGTPGLKHVSDWSVTLSCAAVQRGMAKVKVQGPNRTAEGQLMTFGTLHVSYGRLAALIRMLWKGGARLELTGTFVAQHPELRALGRGEDAA